jgi:hypothetical protein
VGEVARSAHDRGQITPGPDDERAGWNGPGASGILTAMRWALAFALCGAGCFSDRGVAVEVDVGGTGATSVELYLGTQRCDPSNAAVDIDCTTIAPPDGTVALRGTIWFRDDLLPYTAAVKGRRATFQLRADTVSTLPIAIAVGMDASGGAVGTATLHDLAIPVNSARVVTTTLVAANPLAPRDTDTRNLTEDRALVWTKRTPASSCVVVEHWDHGQVARDFVVPIEDPDCDDVQAECNPAAYHGTSAVGGSSASPDCVLPSAERCVLGGFGCSDDVPGKTTTCVALQRQICVPHDFCQCSDLAGSCIQMTLDSSPLTIPHIECDLPSTPELGVCGGHNSDTIDLSQPYKGLGCGHQPLLSSLHAAGFAASREFAGGATIELSTASDPCGFKISWKGGTLATANPNDDGVILLQTSNGALLLPLVLRFHTATCITTPFRCVLVDHPDDALWSCVE